MSSKVGELLAVSRNEGIYAELQCLLKQGQSLSGGEGTYIVTLNDEDMQDEIWRFCRFLSYSYVTIMKGGASYDDERIVSSLYSTNGDSLAFEVFFVKNERA